MYSLGHAPDGNFPAQTAVHPRLRPSRCGIPGSAIDDLAPYPPPGDVKDGSPVHFTGERRDKELKLWGDLGIAVRSRADRSPLKAARNPAVCDVPGST